MVKNIVNRIYADFFMPQRLNEYEAILKEALRQQYIICSIERFWNTCQSSWDRDDDSHYLILRHDIDTDLSTAKEMFRIEQQLDINASYYFRLSTLDIPFMRMLHSYGSEASYHYEEIASYAKINHIRDPRCIYSNIDKIKKIFADNLLHLRKITGLPMTIVASHGDFVNRYLQIPNYVLLSDREFRNEQGIIMEVYDNQMIQFCTDRYSDTSYPFFWIPDSPYQAIINRRKVIYLLTHPRHWRANAIENFKDDIHRIIEDISYRR